MFRSLLCWAVLAVVCGGCACPRSQKCCPFAKAECKKDARMLRHVILFKFKEGTTPEQIKEVEKAFVSLPGKISEIKCFEGAPTSVLISGTRASRIVFAYIPQRGGPRRISCASEFKGSANYCGVTLKSSRCRLLDNALNVLRGKPRYRKVFILLLTG